MMAEQVVVRIWKIREPECDRDALLYTQLHMSAHTLTGEHMDIFI